MNEYDDNLDPIAERLERERPVPRPAFRGALRRHLMGERRARQFMPARPRLLVGAYAGSGTLLMAIAAVGLLGVGPLAA
jgi:hypothetical protein